MLIRKTIPVSFLILAAIVFAIYFRTLSFPFLEFDDDRFVFLNPWVREGLTWSSIVWAFQAGLTSVTFYTDYWQPVTVLSRLMDVELFGLAPWGHHLTNVVWHAVNACLVMVFFGRQLGVAFRGRTPKAGYVPVALLGAALWASHPAHAEAVSWITARKDLLSAFFSWCFLLSYRKGWAGSLFLLLALLSKPSGLVVVPIVWCLEISRTNFKVTLQKYGFYGAIAAVFVGVYWFSQSAGSFRHATAFHHVWQSLTHYGFYFFKANLPIQLGIYAPLSKIWGWAAGLVVLHVIGIFLLHRKHGVSIVGTLWFLIALAPVVGFGYPADRFLYFAIPGLLLQTLHILQFMTTEHFVLSRLGYCFLSFIVIVQAVFAFNQTATWASTEAVFKNALKIDEKNYTALNGLGGIYFRQEKYDQAIPYLLKAYEIRPDFRQARLNIGAAYFALGQVDKAQSMYESMLQDFPNNPIIYNNLAVIHIQKGNYSQAEKLYLKSLELRPNHAPTLANLRELQQYLDKRA